VLKTLCLIESELGASLALSHEVAHARLAWWREECERCERMQPLHPLTRTLLAARGEPHALSGLAGLIDTAVWDLAAATFQTRRELATYCETWAAALIEPAASGAPVRQPGPWRRLGAALREIELLANLAHEARRGRLRVPLAELDAAGVAPLTLSSPPWPHALAGLLRARHEALRTQLGVAASSIEPGAQPAARGLLVWARLAFQLSTHAERALPGVLTPRRLAMLSASWAAWRAARDAMHQRLRLQ